MPPASAHSRLRSLPLHSSAHRPIVRTQPIPCATGADVMSHKPPKEDKKKALLTPKEKKAIKKQKKHAGDAGSLLKH